MDGTKGSQSRGTRDAVAAEGLRRRVQVAGWALMLADSKAQDDLVFVGEGVGRGWRQKTTDKRQTQTQIRGDGHGLTLRCVFDLGPWPPSDMYGVLCRRLFRP